MEIKEIRALSWKEPFATLMLHGKIETRTWATKYRGLVLICASKKGYSFNEIMNISGPRLTDRITEITPYNHGHFWNEYGISNGMTVAVGELVECREMVRSDSSKCFVKYRDPWKVVRNDGITVIKRLWCHIYENVRPVMPIPFKGSQGWRKLDQDFIKQIEFIKE